MQVDLNVLQRINVEADIDVELKYEQKVLIRGVERLIHETPLIRGRAPDATDWVDFFEEFLADEVEAVQASG